MQIESNIDQIVSLSQEQEELTEASVLLVFDLLESVMMSVNEIAAPSSSLSKLFAPLSTVSAASLFMSSLAYDHCIALVDEVSYHIATDMTIGEPNFCLLYTSPSPRD